MKVALKKFLRPPCVGGSHPSETMALFLDPPGSTEISKWQGPETIVDTVCEDGFLFIVHHGKYGGFRYLVQTMDGVAVAAAQGTMKCPGYPAVLSNIYTRPDRRQQGLATRLVKRFFRDNPKGRLSPGLTAMGARFFGVIP